MINNKMIGVMQGRLLPKYQDRYQAHPVGYWEKEFSIAATYNLDCIEFILDYVLFQKNPLMTQDGNEKIKECIDKNQVNVRSICADYFMEKPFHHFDIDVVKESEIVMIKLINNCKNLGVENIVIPCVDNSSFNNEDDMKRFLNNTKKIIDKAEQCNINLNLETDLNPVIFSQFLSEFSSSRITVNYDTGNSASLGFNILEEFKLYGEKITDIHIKDRNLNGGSVILGEGDVNFKLFFEALSLIKYENPFVMQAYRDDEGIKVFERQLNFFQSQLIKFRN